MQFISISIFVPKATYYFQVWEIKVEMNCELQGRRNQSIINHRDENKNELKAIGTENHNFLRPQERK